MKQINATRDEIVEMLKKGEIVFASKKEASFEEGHGITKHGYCLEGRRAESRLIAYGENCTRWFVEYPNQENTTPEELEFREGDIVEHVVTGEQYILRGCSGMSPEYVLATTKGEYTFDRFGRVLSSYKYPSIRLIKRPKKQKKIEIVWWVNVYPDDILPYSSAESAIANARKNLIAVAVEMRGHYFIEEE